MKLQGAGVVLFILAAVLAATLAGKWTDGKKAQERDIIDSGVVVRITGPFGAQQDFYNVSLESGIAYGISKETCKACAGEFCTIWRDAHGVTHAQ